MLLNPCKTLGFKKNMVYEIPHGGSKPYPASGLYAPDTKNLEMRSEVNVMVLVTQNGVHHSPIPGGIDIPNVGFQPQLIKTLWSRHDYSRNYVICKGHSDTKLVRNMSPSKDASIYQNYDS